MNRSAGHAARAGGRRRRGRRIAGLAVAGLALASVLGGGALAAEPLTVPLPAPFPPVRVLTLLVALHLLGLSFGLGGATMLDFWILRWMRWGSLPGEIARIFLFISKVVSVGLGLLWLSGLGFLAVYALESPEKFDNPKLWAKIVVVLALTINGLVIHAVVLPGVLRDIGRPMLDGVSGMRTGIFLVSGAVSGVSWYTAFALGLMRELNGRVPAGLLLALWVAGVLAASLGAYFYWLHLREWSVRQVTGVTKGQASKGQTSGGQASTPARAAPADPAPMPAPADVPARPALRLGGARGTLAETAAALALPAIGLAEPASRPAEPGTPASPPPPVALPPAEPARPTPVGPARIPADRILALPPAAARARPAGRA
ncbi:hypothetical protein SAMN02799631_02934 [Methylobacterium sp. 174MFSha1.1]|uniref:hypothetical protein n=1 Tax=Methylobacterium sp. 174MFSha1.1 TaxID=1502749 RepID=UPI0008E76082|nr:hypothetical protein [Methylobacterium sp. 174MFSha1.1]SFU88796.1 hypothetical protein SAMN02799631_02934 [Methylobacterium sp. 174MFSha1.1]